jgi:hypothetical protein
VKPPEGGPGPAQSCQVRAALAKPRPQETNSQAHRCVGPIFQTYFEVLVVEMPKCETKVGSLQTLSNVVSNYAKALF